MSDEFQGFLSSMESRGEQQAKIMEKLFAAAQPGAIFSAPVAIGDYTVITASEVTAGGGFGSGFALGGQPGQQAEGPSAQPTFGSRAAAGGGGGMGGGGGSAGRPVAIITVGPGGVRVEPVLDVTKIALAALTAWGAMLIALSRMRKASKG